MNDSKISDLTGYTTPLDADVLPIVDTANVATKKVTWANIKATLKTYFDTLYKNFGYTLFHSFTSFSPADATTYYWGQRPASAAAVPGTYRIYIPKAGTIKRVDFAFYQTAGSAETSSVSLRLNNTTDTLLSNAVVNNAQPTVFSATVAIAVVAGDYVEFKWVTPTWATNPTSVVGWGNIYIE